MHPAELSPTGDGHHLALESARVKLGTGRPGGGLRRAGRTGKVETGVGTGGKEAPPGWQVQAPCHLPASTASGSGSMLFRAINGRRRQVPSCNFILAS